MLTPVSPAESIFGRLRLVLAVVFGMGAAAALTAAWFFSNSAATEAYDSLLISAAVQIAETIGVEEGEVVVTPPDAAFETLALSQGDRFFYSVGDTSGRMLTGTADLAASMAATRRPSPRLVTIHYAGATMRAVVLDHFLASPRGPGWCRVVVAQTREARRRMALHLMNRIGAIVFAVSGLGFFASLEAARRAFRPLDRIGQALGARSANDLSPLEVKSPRETVALVQSINDVMARLNERMAKLQTFTAVAAHQIRTPLAAIGLQTELLTEERTAIGRRQRVDRVRFNVAKLSRVTNQLLGQAMVSYRSESVPHSVIDIVGLARGVVHDSVPHALTRDLSVEVTSSAPVVRVTGDAVSLREGLSNLVDNAVTHGAPNVLRVRVEEHGAEVLIVVADDGHGIEPEQWDRVQIPFAVPRSEREGAGLGMSIAGEIARAHGGRLGLGFSQDGLFEVTMHLQRVSKPV